MTDSTTLIEEIGKFSKKTFQLEIRPKLWKFMQLFSSCYSPRA